jgi:hypothetical protein
VPNDASSSDIPLAQVLRCANDEGAPAKIFRPEHIIAIAASVGRQKDKGRIQQLFQQAEIDKALLENILQRYKLQLPDL